MKKVINVLDDEKETTIYRGLRLVDSIKFNIFQIHTMESHISVDWKVAKWRLNGDGKGDLIRI